MLIQSSLSLQYVQVSVTATNQGAAINPTSDAVAFAFTIGGVKPGTGDWQAGSWDGTTPRTGGNYIAQCLIGPGGPIQLSPGNYTMWIRVTANPEVPVINVGILAIT